MKNGILIYRIVLFVVATFAFVVLFDHGPKDFGARFVGDVRALIQWATAR